jgi:hypothetical protein
MGGWEDGDLGRREELATSSPQTFRRPAPPSTISSGRDVRIDQSGERWVHDVT